MFWDEVQEGNNQPQGGQQSRSEHHHPCATAGCRSQATDQDKGDKKWYCGECWANWEEEVPEKKAKTRAIKRQTPPPTKGTSGDKAVVTNPVHPVFQSAPQQQDQQGDPTSTLAPSEFEDEVEMLLSMYPDELSTKPSSPSAAQVAIELRMQLLGGFQLDIQVPQKGYPVEVMVSAQVSKGPNELLASRLDRLVRKLTGVTAATAVAMGSSPNSNPSPSTHGSSNTLDFVEALPLDGSPVIFLLIQTVQQEVDAILTEMESDKEAKQKEADDYEEARKISEMEQLEDGGAVFKHKITSSGIQILAGSNIIGDRKSKFMAHIANISEEEHCKLVCDQLRMNNSIAGAAHPCIYAYRFTHKKTGKLHSDSDDDGESGARAKMMFLLDSMKLDGYLVVVTRWYGGIHLGADRFKHISTVAQDAIREHCK